SDLSPSRSSSTSEARAGAHRDSHDAEGPVGLEGSPKRGKRTRKRVCPPGTQKNGLVTNSLSVLIERCVPTSVANVHPRNDATLVRHAPLTPTQVSSTAAVGSKITHTGCAMHLSVATRNWLYFGLATVVSLISVRAKKYPLADYPAYMRISEALAMTIAAAIPAFAAQLWMKKPRAYHLWTVLLSLGAAFGQ